jgi:hypothetical protein
VPRHLHSLRLTRRFAVVQTALKKSKSSGTFAHAQRLRAPQKRKAKSAVERVAKKASAKSIGIIERQTAQQAHRHHGQKPLHVVKLGADVNDKSKKARLGKSGLSKAKPKKGAAAIVDGMKRAVVVPQQFTAKQTARPRTN